MDNDNGTVSPTAALASMPYTPNESMKALKYFYCERGSELFGKYGPYDAFNDSRSWVKESYIGIDQGPIVIMIENHRTGLLWKNVMKDTDVQAGLDKLGFQYKVINGVREIEKNNSFKIYPNPAANIIHLSYGEINQNQSADVKVFSMDGRLLLSQKIYNNESSVDCSFLRNGFYVIQLKNGTDIFREKLVVKK